MTHRGFIEKEASERGIGNVLIVRLKSGGRFEAGVFLVDSFCLGVKNAFAIDSSKIESVDGLLEAIFQCLGFEEVTPACARKFVEGAVGYAKNLGFAPHRDYSKAARVFGGIRTADCEEEFVFGKEGKPFYIQGPHDSPEKARRILQALDAKLGSENYDYIVLAGSFPNQDQPGRHA